MVDPAVRSGARLALLTLPFVIMAGVMLTRALIGPGFGLLPLLALGPALAAAAGGFRYTAVAGATALALAALLAYLQPPQEGVRQELVALSAVVGVTLASVVTGMARERRERELADVRAVAEVAQQVLLRPVLDRADPVTFAVRCISASPHAQIGGDLYEALATPAGTRLIVGDVEGKGLPAVQTASTALGAFREAAFDAPSLTAIAARIEASLGRQPADDHFLTAILAQVSPDGSRIDLLNCGHPPPLLVSRGAPRFIEPAEPGLPLGLAKLAAFPRIPACLRFAPGDQLLLYTDGVTEARNAAGDYFPLPQACCVCARDLEPEMVLDRLSDEVRQHVGHALEDDVAMLLIRHEGNGRVPRTDPARDGPCRHEVN